MTKPALGALAALISMTFCTDAALARSLSKAEQSSLNEARDNFMAALEGDDFGYFFEAMPPKVAVYIATSAGMTPDELNEQMIAALEQTMAGTNITDATMKTEKIEVEEACDADDACVVYGFAPTSMAISVDGADPTTMEAQTLAMHDGERWYLVRTNDPRQVAILKETYPMFKGVTFPGGAVTPQ